MKEFELPQHEESIEGNPSDEMDRPMLSELRRSVTEISRILYVRRWLFFVPFCLVVSTAFVLSLYVQRRYVCTTTFERRDDPVLVNLPRNEGSGAFITFRRTLSQDVTNSEMITDVARDLDSAHNGENNADPSNPQDPASFGPMSPEDTDRSILAKAKKIAGGLKVRLLQQSDHLDVIQIEYTGSDPASMIPILDAVRDSYIETTQTRITSVLKRTREWFEHERQKRHDAVEAMEDALIEFRTEHQGLDPLDPRTGIARLASARADLLKLERRQKDLQNQVDGRREFLDGTRMDIPGKVSVNFASSIGLETPKASAESRRLASQLKKLNEELRDLTVTRGMTERHPKIVELTSKRRVVADALDQQQSLDAVATSVNGVFGRQPDELPLLNDSPAAAAKANARMEMRIFEKMFVEGEVHINEVQTAIAELEALQHDALVHRKEFSRQRAEVDRARGELALYQGYADQVGRVLAAENSQRGILFGKIKPATGSSVPASPRLPTVLVLAATSGLTISVILVLLSELFDRTIRTRKQVVSVLGLPILESIGEIVTARVRRRRFARQFIFTPAVSFVLVAGVLGSGSLAYLNLRDRLLFNRAVETPKIVFDKLTDTGTSDESDLDQTLHDAEQET